MNDDSAPRFPERSSIGNNSIQRFLWSTPLGELYEAMVGSTMHEYGLLVLSPDIHADLATVQAVIAPLRATSDPCLAKPFACGEDAGALWIRMELTESVPLRLLLGRRDTPRGVDEDDEPRVEDGEDLRTALNGVVPQSILWPMVGDLLEGMEAVHRAGGLLGDMGLRDIGFESNVRHNGTAVVSKWCNYGLLALRDPKKAAKWDITADVRNTVALFRVLLCGAADAELPHGAWPEWKAFFAAADAPGATAEGLSNAFTAMLAAHRLSRPQRIRPEDTIPAAAGEGEQGDEDAPAPERFRPRTPPRSYRRDASGAVRNGGRPFAIAVALVAVAGIIVTVALPKNAFRRILASISPETVPADTAAADADTSRSDTASPGSTSASAEPGRREPFNAERVWALSRDMLEGAAADTDHADTLPFRMRLAFLVAQGDADHEPDPARANEIAAPAIQAMESRTPGIDLALDRACEFWRGYALMAGVGVEADPPRGAVLLEQCADTHHDPRAMAILGDYYASGAEDGINSANDRLAVQRWIAALDAQPKGDARWPSYAFACADKVVGLFFLGRGIPETDQDRYIAGLELAAQKRHIPSMLALGHAYLNGRAVKADAPTAKKWFSLAYDRGSAEGMFHMADILRLGLVSAPSDPSALLWYRRAAKAGNADAMRAIAKMLREKRVLDPDGAPLDMDNGRTADEWEAAADAAEPPPPLPRTTWWLGAQNTRFPQPELGRIR